MLRRDNKCASAKLDFPEMGLDVRQSVSKLFRCFSRCVIGYISNLSNPIFLTSVFYLDSSVGNAPLSSGFGKTEYLLLLQTTPFYEVSFQESNMTCRRLRTDFGVVPMIPWRVRASWYIVCSSWNKTIGSYLVFNLPE